MYTNLGHQFSKLMGDFSILCPTLEDESDLKIHVGFLTEELRNNGVEK